LWDIVLVKYAMKTDSEARIFLLEAY